ncbi:MAG TPA: PilC/PilY family type IV pilus protein [Gammaproteobacteria bacterium]|nr:PilC/PilY family type IV pilus protein [Gammaproteobacteria bacterium]
MNIRHSLGFLGNTAKVVLSAVLVLGSNSAFAETPNTQISDVPLTLVQPTHPEVLILLGNSQSMDGDLGGAIMTGSGTMTSVATDTSSPTNYTVPTGFTPPCDATVTDGSTPYTITQSGGTLCDNSASRLNLAKAAIADILQQYSGNTDFGLMDFSTGTPVLDTTWVYYMSAPGGFTFSDSPTGTEGVNWVYNPCYLQTGTGCSAISKYYAGMSKITNKYLQIAKSSDDPSVNDVLYATGSADTFLTYDGIYKSDCTTAITSPYSDFSLSDYEAGNILVCYKETAPGALAFATGPTNAGYVPYSTEVMYAPRGFGYDATVDGTKGNLLVPIVPATCAATGTACGHPTQSDINTYVSKFAGFLKPETNDVNTNEIKAVATQSALAGLLTGAYNYYNGTYPDQSAPVSGNGCAGQRYVVLVTDGLPTMDTAGKYWPPLGSAAAVGYSVTATFNDDGSLASTNDQALQDTIDEITNLKGAGIKTYVIGLGAGVNTASNPDAAAALKAMAVAGGTIDYFPATTPQDVASKMQVIMSHVEAANLTTTAAAVNSTGLRSDTVVYQGQFESQDQYGDWTGNLYAYPVASDGSVDTSTGSANWSAQTQLDAANWDTGRRIVTWNPATGQGEPFRAGTYITTTSKTGQALMLGSGTTLDAAQLQDVVQYLRGDPLEEQRNSGGYRSRAHILGDIVDSNPLFIGAPRMYISNSSYLTFQSTNKSRTPMIYVGANDGYLHAFKAATGQEVFAFAPYAVLDTLYDLTKPDYNTGHRFYVDGSPTASDVQFADGTWHTVLAGGLDHGGQGIYAMDVTDPDAMTSETTVASKVLWEDDSTTSGFGTLGYTYSQPQIGDVCLAFDDTTGECTANKWIMIFGSGYNNSDGQPYLYIVNAETGALLGTLALCSGDSSACDTTVANGASTPALVSSSGSPFDDMAYIGDLQGNLWRIKLNCTGSSSSVSCSPSDILLFKAQNGSGQNQPITTQPLVSFHPAHPARAGLMVYFGTGKFLGTGDLTDATVQSFYGVWDKTTTSNTVTRTQLVQQVLTSVTVTPPDGTTVEARVVTNNTINWDEKAGWYMDLPESGERVITDPRLDKGRLIFTTYVPSATQSTSLCEAGGQSFLMVLNYASGGSFTMPEIDLNGDGQLDGDDQVNTGTDADPNKQNPVGVGLGKGYATSPTILRTSQGNIGDIKLITKSNGHIASVKERGSDHQRSSWKQIH